MVMRLQNSTMLIWRKRSRKRRSARKKRKKNFNSGLTSKYSLASAPRSKNMRANHINKSLMSRRTTSKVIVSLVKIVTIGHQRTTRPKAHTRKSTKKRPSARLASLSSPARPLSPAQTSALKTSLKPPKRRKNKNQSEP